MDLENFDAEEEKRKIKDKLRREHLIKKLTAQAKKELEDEGFFENHSKEISEQHLSVDLTNRDKLFEDCARTVVQTQSGSPSMLQRRFNLGYNRAGRIMDQLEAADIVGPSQGSKPRNVLVKTESELERILRGL